MLTMACTAVWLLVLASPSPSIASAAEHDVVDTLTLFAYGSSSNGGTNGAPVFYADGKC